MSSLEPIAALLSAMMTAVSTGHYMLALRLRTRYEGRDLAGAAMREGARPHDVLRWLSCFGVGLESCCEIK
jgi:hypothetical protein